jgi:hypothetical protein
VTQARDVEGGQADWIWLPPRSRPKSGIALVRRGVHHGHVVPRVPSAPDSNPPEILWREARPVLLRGALLPSLPRHRAEIASTLRMFERLRGGGSFEREVRLRTPAGFRPAGVSVDLGDEREIEKVHVDEVHRGRRVARDLYAKLSWIGRDPGELSLRIRFSFGAERLSEWVGDPRRAVAADRFAEALFPEGRLLSRHARLADLLASLCGSRTRLSERIVYSNAPGGGAAFHHDAEPVQLGVVYGQLAGRTAWLALPKRELARELAALSPRRLRTGARAMRALDEPSPGTERLLNRDPRLTRRLVEIGAFHLLEPGDLLLLPSHAEDETAWHSVFAVGGKASLAHSYGIFRGR